MAGDRVDVEALEALILDREATPEQKRTARRLLAANTRLNEAAAELRAAGVEVDESDFEPLEPDSPNDWPAP